MTNVPSQGRKGDRRAILELIDSYLDEVGIRNVLPSMDRPAPPEDDSLLHDEHCRIRLLIEGELSFITPAPDGKIVQLQLAPGDVLFSIPGAWSLRSHNSHRRMISVTLMPEYIRFVITNRTIDTPRGHAVQHWRHTSSPASAETALVVQALNTCAHNGAEPDTMHHLITALIHLLRKALDEDRGGKQGKAHVTWQLLREYVDEYYHLPIDRNSVSAEFRLAPDYVSRLFRKEGNEGFTQYLTRMRMQRALSLVEGSRLRIYEIAARCGYENDNYFIKAFRKFYGSSPGRLRGK